MCIEGQSNARKVSRHLVTLGLCFIAGLVVTLGSWVVGKLLPNVPNTEGMYRQYVGAILFGVLTCVARKAPEALYPFGVIVAFGAHIVGLLLLLVVA